MMDTKNNKTSTELDKKKLVLEAWTKILLSQNKISSQKYNLMIQRIQTLQS